MRYWTIALIGILIADSAVTVFIGHENNPLILWVMSTFDVPLKEAMILRLLFCAPLVYIVDKYKWSKFTAQCYIALYIILAGLQ